MPCAPDIPVDQLMQDPRAQAVAAAAEKLDEYRERWLNPPEWTVRVPIAVGNYPDRILPKDEVCAKKLKKRTLTALYNEMPEWLRQLHAELDAAVARAYGWPEDISEDEAMRRLFEMNQARVANQS